MAATTVPCPLCSSKLSSRQGLSAHLRRVHDTTISEQGVKKPRNKKAPTAAPSKKTKKSPTTRQAEGVRTMRRTHFEVWEDTQSGKLYLLEPFDA